MINFKALDDTSRVAKTPKPFIQNKLWYIYDNYFLGFVSVRDEQQGSWFIQHLVEVFRDNATHEHVMDMLTQVHVWKRNFKQYWATILPISTKRTITSHHNWTQNTTTYDVGNPGPGLGQAHKCGRVKPVNGIPILPSW